MMQSERFTLHQLNATVRRTLKQALPLRYWVVGELSEVRTNYASGHCYVELVEKQQGTGNLIAKARGMIHAACFRMLKPYFESKTGSPLAAGMQLLVEVSIEFHELYGYTLQIHDIDPTYTLGDMARHRQEVLQQLAEDGVLDMNKELPWSTLPQRIAVISSPTAAGYEDFMHQLHHNAGGYAFYTALFAATMQGAQAEGAIIGALERIYHHQEQFDVVVIIRGGGSTSDLSCFDSYLLAEHIAQFPLPVVTGIGHDRDKSVADCVASISVKTPTAAAELLVSRMEEQGRTLRLLQEQLLRSIALRLQEEEQRLARLTHHIPRLAQQRLAAEQLQLAQYNQQLRMRATHLLALEQQRLALLSRRIPLLVSHKIANQEQTLATLQERLRSAASQRLLQEEQHLRLLERTVELTSPFKLLERGYTLSLQGGRVVKRASDLVQGETLTTLFADGEVTSTLTPKPLKTK